MQQCEHHDHCTHQHNQTPSGEDTCYWQVVGYLDRCWWRQPMPCGHARVYERTDEYPCALMTPEERVVSRVCLKCKEEEARDATV